MQPPGGRTSAPARLPRTRGERVLLALLALSFTSSNPAPSTEGSVHRAAKCGCTDISRLMLRGGGKRMPMSKRGRQPPPAADLASAVAAIINSPPGKQAKGPDAPVFEKEDEELAPLAGDHSGGIPPARGIRAVRGGHESGRAQPASKSSFGNSDKILKSGARSRVRGRARGNSQPGARSMRDSKPQSPEPVHRSSEGQDQEVLPDVASFSEEEVQNVAQGDRDPHGDQSLGGGDRMKGRGSPGHRSSPPDRLDGSGQELVKVREAILAAEQRAQEEASKRIDAERLNAHLAAEVKAARQQAAAAVESGRGAELQSESRSRQQIVLGHQVERQVNTTIADTEAMGEEDSQERDAMRMAAQAAQLRAHVQREDAARKQSGEEARRARELAEVREGEGERAMDLENTEIKQEEKELKDEKSLEDPKPLEEEGILQEGQTLREEGDERRLAEEELAVTEARRASEEAAVRAKEEERRAEEEARFREEHARLKEAEERAREEQDRLERLRCAREAEEGFLDRCAVLEASLAAGENDMACSLLAALRDYVGQCGGLLGQGYAEQVGALATRLDVELHRARDTKAGRAEVERGKAAVSRGEWEAARSCFRTARAAFEKAQCSDGIVQVKGLMLWADDARAKATMGKAHDALARVETLLQTVHTTLALGAAGEQAAEKIKRENLRK